MVGADVEENPRGTRVSLFFFSFFLACVSLFFFVLHSSFFNATDLKTKSSNHLPSILPLLGSPRSTHPAFNRPDRLFVLPLFFRAPNTSSDLFFLCSSSDRSCFVLLQNRVLETWSKTRFCFLELKSIRLEIYMASFCQLTKWESSL